MATNVVPAMIDAHTITVSVNKHGAFTTTTGNFQEAMSLHPNHVHKRLERHYSDEGLELQPDLSPIVEAAMYADLWLRREYL